MQIPLTTGTAEKGVTGGEKLINLYPQKSDGKKYPFYLTGTPGLAKFSKVESSSILGLHNMNGRLFAVTSTKLYEIFSNGESKDIGNLNVMGRVSIADNGFQMIIVDGYKGFYYDENTKETNEIIQEGFYPSRTVAYQDGYFILERKGTSEFFYSNLLSVDFDGNNYGSAEGQPDNIVAVLSDHRELFFFGEESIEVWYNSGASDLPFERAQGAFIEKGCPAPYTAQKIDNTVFFVGSDYMVYRMNGYVPQRISDNNVEQILANSEISDAFAYTYHEDGSLFYVLTIPYANTTVCYDVVSQSWHTREDYYFGRHRSNCEVFCFGRTIVGDFQSGLIFDMTKKTYGDDGNPIQRVFVLPTINNERNYISINHFELDMDVGIAPENGQGSDPIAIVNYSIDNGRTWSNDKFGRLGKIGEYLNRVQWFRFGAGRQFLIKVSITDPIHISIGGAYIE